MRTKTKIILGCTSIPFLAGLAYDINLTGQILLAFSPYIIALALLLLVAFYRINNKASICIGVLALVIANAGSAFYGVLIHAFGGNYAFPIIGSIASFTLTGTALWSHFRYFDADEYY